MALDLPLDAHRVRLAVLVTSLATLAVLAAAGVHALTPGWRRHQRDFVASGAVEKSRELGVLQRSTCTGEVDRCATCHLGAERADLADPRVPQPLRGHSLPLGAHTAAGVGCADCHGGSGRALDPVAAHAFPGTSQPDPLMKGPHLQAACARCHVPGETKGMERLVHGTQVFAQYGCAICHPLSGDGRGGWDFGPDLRATARRSVQFLETSLKEPTADFPDSTMPSFRTIAAADPTAFTDLLVFLQSLPLSRPERCNVRGRSQPLADLSCASCHAGPKGTASGRLQHRCAYLIDRKDQLRCGGCHAEVPQATGRGCPVEREHRGACAACHDPGSQR